MIAETLTAAAMQTIGIVQIVGILLAVDIHQIHDITAQTEVQVEQVMDTLTAGDTLQLMVNDETLGGDSL